MYNILGIRSIASAARRAEGPQHMLEVLVPVAVLVPLLVLAHITAPQAVNLVCIAEIREQKQRWAGIGCGKAWWLLVPPPGTSNTRCVNVHMADNHGVSFLHGY